MSLIFVRLLLALNFQYQILDLISFGCVLNMDLVTTAKMCCRLHGLILPVTQFNSSLEESTSKHLKVTLKLDQMKAENSVFFFVVIENKKFF